MTHSFLTGDDDGREPSGEVSPCVVPLRLGPGGCYVQVAPGFFRAADSSSSERLSTGSPPLCPLFLGAQEVILVAQCVSRRHHVGRAGPGEKIVSCRRGLRRPTFLIDDWLVVALYTAAALSWRLTAGTIEPPKSLKRSDEEELEANAGRSLPEPPLRPKEREKRRREHVMRENHERDAVNWKRGKSPEVRPRERGRIACVCHESVGVCSHARAIRVCEV